MPPHANVNHSHTQTQSHKLKAKNTSFRREFHFVRREHLGNHKQLTEFNIVELLAVTDSASHTTNHYDLF